MEKKKKRKQTPRSQVPRASEKVHDGQVWLLQERRRLLGRRPGKKGRGLSRCIGRRAFKLSNQLVPAAVSAASTIGGRCSEPRDQSYSLVAKSLSSLSTTLQSRRNLYNAAEGLRPSPEQHLWAPAAKSVAVPWTPLPHLYPSIT